MNNQSDDNTHIRLDKWLWAARFYKTRTIARKMVDGGKVHYNGQRSKSSKRVIIGAEIRLRQGNEEKIVTILSTIIAQRRTALEAQMMYQETVTSIDQRKKLAEIRKANALTMSHPDRRPNKKERRHLLHFKHDNNK